MASTDIAGSPGRWLREAVLQGEASLGDAAHGRVFRAVATVCVVSMEVLALAVVVLKVLGKG